MAAREHLFASTFWGVCRPKFPLTPGHFVIRLNDPSLAFDAASATDLLRCYGRLRQALVDVSGATAAQLCMSRNWQPVGDAIGEPVSETSTPSLHTFFTWPGSPKASAALKLPAHQRVRSGETAALDAALREWAAEASGCPADPSPAPSTEQAPEATDPEIGLSAGPWTSRAFLMEAVQEIPGSPAAAGHWTAVPRGAVDSLDAVGAEALLELAAGVEELAWNSSPRHAGMTVWANDVWGTPAVIHVFGRQHGSGGGQLAAFAQAGGLDLPVRADTWQGKSARPSPTVEK